MHDCLVLLDTKSNSEIHKVFIAVPRLSAMLGSKTIFKTALDTENLM